VARPSKASNPSPGRCARRPSASQLLVGRLLAPLVFSLVLSPSFGSTDDAPNEWPPLRLGVWEQKTVRILPSGKTEAGTLRRSVCHHPRAMFWAYWGLKEVGIGGCAWESKKVSGATYRLRTRCDVKGGGESEGLLTVKSEDSYELTMTTKEGKRITHGTETGHRVGDCARAKASEDRDE